MDLQNCVKDVDGTWYCWDPEKREFVHITFSVVKELPTHIARQIVISMGERKSMETLFRAVAEDNRPL
jgi:hypothetical protein